MSRSKTILLAAGLALLGPAAGAWASPGSMHAQRAVVARTTQQAAAHSNEAIRRELDLRRAERAREAEAAAPASPPPADPSARRL